MQEQIEKRNKRKESQWPISKGVVFLLVALPLLWWLLVAVHSHHTFFPHACPSWISLGAPNNPGVILFLYSTSSSFFASPFFFYLPYSYPISLLRQQTLILPGLFFPPKKTTFVFKINLLKNCTGFMGLKVNYKSTKKQSVKMTTLIYFNIFQASQYNLKTK